VSAGTRFGAGGVTLPLRRESKNYPLEQVMGKDGEISGAA